MHGFEEQDYSKRFDMSLWKRLSRFALPYKRLFVILFFLIAAVGTVDAVFPILNRYAIDRLVSGGGSLAGFIAVLSFFILIQSLNVFLFIKTAGKIEMGLSYSLRKKGFERLQELSFSYYDTTPAGWIMARMTSDSTRLGEIVSWGLVDMVWGIFMMTAIMVFMFIMNARLALITLAVVPPLVLVSLYFQKRILKGYRSVRKINSRISGAFNEGIAGARTSKTLSREEENVHEFSELTGSMKAASVRVALLSSLFLPIVLALGSVGTALALVSGGRLASLGAHGITIGTLAAFVTYTVQFFEPVRELARVIAELKLAQASAERLLSLIETEPEIKDSLEVIERYGLEPGTGREEWPEIRGHVEFRDVTFRYKTGEAVLSHFSLSVKAGETVALVGETGAGKSTIVNLVCRFYEPTLGSLLIDGRDYRELPVAWLQRRLGYVLQTPHLFSGTVRENIRYGRLSASDEEVAAAARLVNADEFIAKLPKGYESDVGEGGSFLSTGEKQLISFARAMLADPAVFVLDEATSSIDTETERKIQEAISTVLRNRTSFIIAHRLSTIANADRILVLGKGEIIEEGTHAELLKARSHYFRLYTSQFAEEEETGFSAGTPAE
jgi:ATP-binding cassette subfamily B protein